VLKVLLDSLSNDGKVIQVEVLQTLIDMLKCPELIECFSSYNELLVLKVIYAYKSDEQKVDSSGGSGGRSPVNTDSILFDATRNYRAMLYS
jgi:CLIP-associating protein 1/2